MNGQYNPGDIVLGNWTLKRLIGEGSYGRVFEAEREDFGRTYKTAIKIITIPQSNSEIANARAEGMDDKSLTAYFRSFVEEIVREFELMSELKGNTNIVSYEDHSVVQHEGSVGWDIIIRMELLTTLLDSTTDRSITKQDVIKIGTDMCRALELCQKFNIVHRDIKPENIFITKNGDYKLGDFGIARTAEKTTGMTKVGTTMFMAPEVYRGEMYGSSVDIYSLGIVLYRLLNDNRLPFLPNYPAPITHSDRDTALAKRISGAEMPFPKNADGRLAEIVLKACAYDPKERYSSPIQMRQELDAIQYSREEAALIYPKGDEAPIKSKEYINSARSANIKRERTRSLFEKAVESELESQSHDDLQEHEKDSAKLLQVSVQKASFDDNSGVAEHTQSVFEQPVCNEIEAELHPISEEFTPESVQSTVPEIVEDTRADIEAELEENSTVLQSGLPNEDGYNPPKHSKSIRPSIFYFGISLFNRKRAIVVTVAVFLVLVILAIVYVIRPSEEPESDELMQSSDIISPLPEVKTEWSEWRSELPISGSKDYIIEEKLLYRSASALQSNEADLAESGYTLYNIIYGDYSEWSDWQRNAVEESELVEVESLAQSRRCNMVTRTQYFPGPVTRTWIECSRCGSANSCYSNWTEYRYRQREITYCYYLEESWSEFSDQPIIPGDTVLVNTKPVYRYIHKDAVEQGTASISNFPALANDYTGYFADVDDSKWYGNRSIKCLGIAAQLGAIIPDEYLAFRPEENITIAEAIKAAVVINRIYYGESGILVETADWYKVYVDYAIENDIISDFDFPDYTAEATRQDVAYIFSMALPKSELAGVNTVTSITDMDENSKYYRSAYLLAQAGIVEWPTPEYSFNADAYMTRAEAAVLVARLVKPSFRIINS